MTQLIFVYGTLRRAHTPPAFKPFAENATFVCEAAVAGRLEASGTYTALVAGEDDSLVPGELFEIPSEDAFIAQLDDYEGHEYRRAVVTAQTADGKRVRAFAYVLNVRNSGCKNGEDVGG